MSTHKMFYLNCTRANIIVHKKNIGHYINSSKNENKHCTSAKINLKYYIRLKTIKAS